MCVTLSLTIINYFLNSVTDQSIVQDPKQSLQTQQQCLLDIIVASAVVNFLCVVDALLNVLYHIVASGPVQSKDSNNACLLSTGLNSANAPNLYICYYCVKCTLVYATIVSRQQTSVQLNAKAAGNQECLLTCAHTSRLMMLRMYVRM